MNWKAVAGGGWVGYAVHLHNRKEQRDNCWESGRGPSHKGAAPTSTVWENNRSLLGWGQVNPYDNFTLPQNFPLYCSLVEQPLFFFFDFLWLPHPVIWMYDGKCQPMPHFTNSGSFLVLSHLLHSQLKNFASRAMPPPPAPTMLCVCLGGQPPPPPSLVSILCD